MSFFDFLRKKNPKIGLALSGGATRGAAHIGVLQVLEREGIRPSFVAGTSAGALVGAAYCAGIPLEEISRMFLKMSWPTLLKPSIFRPLSLFDTTPMEEYIRKNIGDCEFKDLQIPFSAIACDIVTGERVILNNGPLAPAARASAAIPGLFSPVEIDGRLLVDGGTVDNFPALQVKAMGADYVIGVDLSKSQDSGRRPTNPFDVLLDMINIMQARSAVADASECNCYIRPDVSKFSSWTFGDAEQIMAAGVAAADYVLPQLRKELLRK
jgi:NTE family protein